MENFYKRKELRKYLPKVDNPNIHLHQLDKLPFRMIVCAPSGSGKSNFLLNLIEKYSKGKGTFHSVHLICRSKCEPLYEYLEDKTKKKIKILEGVKEIPDINKFDKEQNHLVIFDDLVLEKDQSKINEFYIRGRKKGVSICYLSQSFYKVPKVIRSNCNYFVILKLSGKRDLNLIMSEFELGIDKQELLEIYEDATKEKFNILLIDVEAEKNQKFRKNFLEFYQIDDE
tara:strand:+ start:1104 stop:1787 length:684 start_codon:yes stop_codon:yes gene_type:complete